MDPVDLTAEQAAKLAASTNPVPARGPDGKEVGVFLSRKEYNRYALACDYDEPTKEQLDAISRQGGGRSLAEIIKTRLGGA